MDNLLSLVNKELEVWGMQFKVEDILGNGRTGLIIEDKRDIRKEIQKKLNMPYEVMSELVERFKDYQIRPVISSESFTSYLHPLVNFEFFYDCQDWVFDEIGLPDHTHRESQVDVHSLLEQDLPELSWIPRPEKGAVAAYFPKNALIEDAVCHWALVQEINGRIMVQSKWGGGHVYEHPLEMTSHLYGEFICFFRKN